MDFIFVRHAEPAWVVHGLSVLDPDLSERGDEQTAHLAQAASTWEPPTEILVSPTRRTRQTAAPLAKQFAVSPEIIPWYEEIHLPPAWEGAPADEVTQALRDARLRPKEAWWDGLETGESFTDFAERITTNLKALLATRGIVHAPTPACRFTSSDQDQRILVVGHGGSNAVAISFLLGLEQTPWAWERIVSYHTGITRLRSVDLIGGHIFGLHEHGNIQHLPNDLRTR